MKSGGEVVIGMIIETLEPMVLISEFPQLMHLYLCTEHSLTPTVALYPMGGTFQQFSHGRLEKSWVHQ